MAFEHRRRVGEHDGNGVATAKAGLFERAREPTAARIKVPVIASQRAVNDRDAFGKDGRRPLQEGDWRQRLKIRGISFEVAIIRRIGHPASS